MAAPPTSADWSSTTRPAAPAKARDAEGRSRGSSRRAAPMPSGAPARTARSAATIPSSQPGASRSGSPARRNPSAASRPPAAAKRVSRAVRLSVKGPPALPCAGDPGTTRACPEARGAAGRLREAERVLRRLHEEHLQGRHLHPLPALPPARHRLPLPAGGSRETRPLRARGSRGPERHRGRRAGRGHPVPLERRGAAPRVRGGGGGHDDRELRPGRGRGSCSTVGARTVTDGRG